MRSMVEWAEILEKKSSEEAAKFILKDLIHYSNGRAHELDDIKSLANALIAFAAKEI